METQIQPTGNNLPAEQQPVSLIQLALEKGYDIDKFKQLFDMQERWETRQAEKAFLQSMSNFQRTCPKIIKTKEVNYPVQGGGNIKYKYAPLGEITEQIKETLHSNGLSYRFEFSEKANNIVCTCIVSHSAGHSKSTSFDSPKDDTGKKSAIQQIGSTHTYLQRYSLIGALGLSTADDDVDGRQSGKKEAKPEITEAEMLKSAKILKECCEAQDKLSYTELRNNAKNTETNAKLLGMLPDHIEQLKKYINKIYIQKQPNYETTVSPK